MRIDKYLKVSRIIKRRQVAKELADHDRIFINDRLAKASSEIKIEDEILIVFGNKKITVRVLDLKEQVNKENANLLFEIIKEEKNDRSE